ncbi:MAG: hypothetical protein OXG72_07545 [Acidobacteria bacterium]|nr:hypothetical protein [Acidobacteriota bacterium]
MSTGWQRSGRWPLDDLGAEPDSATDHTRRTQVMLYEAVRMRPPGHVDVEQDAEGGGCVHVVRPAVEPDQGGCRVGEVEEGDWRLLGRSLLQSSAGPLRRDGYVQVWRGAWPACRRLGPAGGGAAELERCRAVVGSGCRLRKGEGAALVFAVVLSRGAGSALTVDCATSDGNSAKAVGGGGARRLARRGRETLTLKSWNASSGQITDAGGERNDRERRPAAACAAGAPRPGGGAARGRARGGAA